MHQVAILTLDEMVLLDITISYETFLRTANKRGERCYEVRLVGPKKKIRCSGIPVDVQQSLKGLRQADTVVIPGMEDPQAVLPLAVRTELIRAFERGARLVSICSGALLLAQTGLLDGKRATTHWMAAETLKVRHPTIDVDPNVLYVDNGKLLTSAGAFAGMDLCLHLVRRDFGAETAARLARFSVTPLERDGGQAQFIQHELPESNESLEKTLTWMMSNLQKELSVEMIASRAKMSVRTLNRQFQKQLSMSPQKWMTLLRVNRARELLETTDLNIEEISEFSGFPSALSMREHFRRLVLSSPSQYRHSFRTSF